MCRQILCVAILFSVAWAQERRAIVVLRGEDPRIFGNVTFHQKYNVVAITGTIVGLSEGKHGFHVHEFGNLSGGCASTGSHFNPYKKSHGAPTDAERHVGDLGNILANQEGIATISMADNVIQLMGPNNIIGRAVVVHSGVDDLGKGGNAESLKTGNAGSRVVCGVIGTLDQEASSVSSLYLAPFFVLVPSFLLSLHNAITV
ncbi:superoxide dismutase [Cu-Zn]-like [Rhodnius prolixus]|uniref:Superoxide dismutase [Cu-Zn] n=2 Tax=Rhodnius prolixus TaxID=13249 RepID=R4FMI6_RHOPR